jgi:general secretion pathway protein D
MATTNNSRWILVCAAAAVLLGACAGYIDRAEEYQAQDEWMKAVLEYRRAMAKDPGNVEYKSRLKYAELKAADFYYQRGIGLVDQGNIDGAIVQYQQGLAAMPDHSKLLQAMAHALARKEAQTLYEGARLEAEAGKKEDALRTLAKAIQIYPEHKQAVALAEALDKEIKEAKGEQEFSLTSRAPITLNFRQTDVRAAFEFLGKSFGIDTIFDDGVRPTPVTLFAKDVTFQQALYLMLTTTKTFYKKLGPNTVLIAPDTKDKRGQYEDHIMRTFYLNNIPAKDIGNILKGLVTIKKLIINEQLNTVIVRDTQDVIDVVEKIIEANDRKPAEMILEVEVLEVNRTKAEQLGLELSAYEISANPEAGSIFRLGESVRDRFRDVAVLTVPGLTFRFFKQDVDAKTLANPRVRVLNGKSAKIHIGDRVPLRAATIVDATGQTRTTFDYREIGIKLTAEPTIHLDNSATVKLALEVSTLGENVGTVDEPAFRIGTRNAETFMLLRDGETAILGGLIRDEERSTRLKIPGFGDIPVIGSLFTSYDDQDTRTDVLLTITPRVVRGWDLPSMHARSFASGTEDRYMAQPLFKGFALAAGSRVAISSEAATTPGAAPASAALTPAAEAGQTPAVQPPLFAFSDPVYEGTSGQELEIRMTAENLAGVQQVPMEILFNPQLLKFVRGEAGSIPAQNFQANADDSRGILRVQLNFDESSAQTSGVLARVVMQGVKPGISYLVYRAPSLRGPSGELINAQVRASRVVIK